MDDEPPLLNISPRTSKALGKATRLAPTIRKRSPARATRSGPAPVGRRRWRPSQPIAELAIIDIGPATSQRRIHALRGAQGLVGAGCRSSSCRRATATSARLGPAVSGPTITSPGRPFAAPDGAGGGAVRRASKRWPKRGPRRRSSNAANCVSTPTPRRRMARQSVGLDADRILDGVMTLARTLPAIAKSQEQLTQDARLVVDDGTITSHVKRIRKSSCCWTRASIISKASMAWAAAGSLEPDRAKVHDRSDCFRTCPRHLPAAAWRQTGTAGRGL